MGGSDSVELNKMPKQRAESCEMAFWGLLIARRVLVALASRRATPEELRQIAEGSSEELNRALFKAAGTLLAATTEIQETPLFDDLSCRQPSANNAHGGATHEDGSHLGRPHTCDCEKLGSCRNLGRSNTCDCGGHSPHSPCRNHGEPHKI